MKNLVLLLIVTILFSCQKSDTQESVKPLTLELSPSNRQVVTANNSFAFEFVNKVHFSTSDDNYMVSPLSLSLALGMAYNGSATTTADAFQQVMHFENLTKDEINEFYQRLITYLASETNGSVMEIANSIWIEQTFPVKQNFITLNQNTFGARLQNLDFSNQQSVTTINNWVAEKTHNKIPFILESISPEEKLFLINALYFNAKWKTQFETSQTTSQDFYKTPSEVISVPFMHHTFEVDYLQNATFSSIILPYKSDKFSMVVLVPNENYTVNDVVTQLTAANWNQWLAQYQKQKVEIYLPKFKYSFEKSLSNDLIDLGLGIAFTDSADFSGISDTNLNISKVLQKTYIDVDEQGTEAAAVTAIGIGVTSVPDYPVFRANRPFVYVIRENTSGAICFIGKTGLPEY